MKKMYLALSLILLGGLLLHPPVKSDGQSQQSKKDLSNEAKDSMNAHLHRSELILEKLSEAKQAVKLATELEIIKQENLK